jgi:hypothetical protein
MKKKKHNLLMTGLPIRDEGCPKGAITFLEKTYFTMPDFLMTYT